MVRYNRGKAFAKMSPVLCGNGKVCKEYAKTAGGAGWDAAAGWRAAYMRPPDCRKTPWPPLGGGSARRRWGRELHAGTKVSGKGEALSLRPFGPPLPLWRKRHLPRIGGVCLPEGGFLTRSGPHICGPYFTQILHNIYFPVVVYPARIHYNRRRYSVNKIREWMCNTG